MLRAGVAAPTSTAEFGAGSRAGHPQPYSSRHGEAGPPVRQGLVDAHRDPARHRDPRRGHLHLGRRLQL